MYENTTTTTIVLRHYTGQPALAGTPLVKNWRILLEQSFMPACHCWWQLVHSD